MLLFIFLEHLLKQHQRAVHDDGRAEEDDQQPGCEEADEEESGDPVEHGCDQGDGRVHEGEDERVEGDLRQLPREVDHDRIDPHQHEHQRQERDPGYDHKDAP